jgi:2'-5' RNA ligase superfamily
MAGLRLHALELVPDEAGDAAVRRDWQALRDAGLPSQLDHRGATNAPHVTVLAVPSVTAVAGRAAELFGPLLPVQVRTTGLLVLGGARLTIARAVAVPDDVVAAVLALRAAVPEPQRPGWLPHLTLARRVERADLQRAVDALGHEDIGLSLATLRHWDPDQRSVATLAGVTVV